jgi:ABC-2 type transport system permease protein
MRALYAIYRKELAHFFVSPVAYIVVALFLFLGGFFFNAILGSVVRYSFEQMMQGMRYGGGMQPMDVPGIVMRGFFGTAGTLMLFLVPLLNIGAYAEERKRGTMELLMTSPISDLQIVLGKFLASLTLLAIMLLPTAGCILYMNAHSDPRPPAKLMLAGYIGLLLLGGALLAIGSFISSLTENQLIAAVLSLGISLVLFVIDVGQRGTTSRMSDVLQYLSLQHQMEDYGHGVVDTTSLIFFASLIVLAVFLTIRSMDSMRWRRA